MPACPLIFQGTFDPFTNGHLALLRTARNLFGPVRVLLLVNEAKTPLFTLPQRLELVRACVAGLDGVSVDSSPGLLVDYMRAQGLTVCLRGVRNGADAAYELHNDALSRALYPALHTLLLACEPRWRGVSSSAVKAACQAGRIPAAWVPPPVQEALKKQFPGVVFE